MTLLEHYERLTEKYEDLKEDYDRIRRTAQDLINFKNNLRNPSFRKRLKFLISNDFKDLF